MLLCLNVVIIFNFKMVIVIFSKKKISVTSTAYIKKFDC